MINENRTYIIFGYYSTNLKPHSSKPIYAICDTCLFERPLSMHQYAKTQGRCKVCASTGRRHSEETKRRISNIKTNPSDEIRTKISIANTGRNHPMYGKHHSDETRQRISATQQNISYNEWTTYATESPYCTMFNENCKEINRNKYDRQCFMCGKLEIDNISSVDKLQKLSVHHVDMNKQQGCDEHLWKLIPVCMTCHAKLHNKRMAACIEYILTNEFTNK